MFTIYLYSVCTAHWISYGFQVFHYHDVCKDTWFECFTRHVMFTNVCVCCLSISTMLVLRPLFDFMFVNAHMYVACVLLFMLFTCSLDCCGILLGLLAFHQSLFPGACCVCVRTCACVLCQHAHCVPSQYCVTSTPRIQIFHLANLSCSLRLVLESRLLGSIELLLMGALDC